MFGPEKFFVTVWPSQKVSFILRVWNSELNKWILDCNCPCEVETKAHYSITKVVSLKPFIIHMYAFVVNCPVEHKPSDPDVTYIFIIKKCDVY